MMDTTRNTYEIMADMLGRKLAEVGAKLRAKGIPLHKSDEVALLLDMVFELSVAFEEADDGFSSAQWDYRIGKTWGERNAKPV